MPYPISLKVDYPDKLSRLTTFFRAIMVIPQSIVLGFIQVAAAIILVIAWFAIIFTGKYPRSLFDFIVYYFRWSTRVSGYNLLLTDKYPPFSGSDDEK